MKELTSRDKNLIYHQRIVAFFAEKLAENMPDWQNKVLWKERQNEFLWCCYLGDSIVSAISETAIRRSIEVAKLYRENINSNMPIWRFDEYHVSGLFTRSPFSGLFARPLSERALKV